MWQAMESPLSFDISPFIQITFYLVLLSFTIFTAILYYHWQNYSMDNKATFITYAAYTLLTLPLLFTMAVIAFVIY